MIERIKTDFLIIGTGIAGLSASLTIGNQAKTVLISKTKIRKSNTSEAQGGIAAALSQEDNTQFHLQDTLEAGNDLCDPQAVKILVEEGPQRVEELIKLGIPFEQKDGQLVFSKEGAHSHRRILHAGDMTGSVLERTLGQAVSRNKNISIFENQKLLSLLIHDNHCYGAYIWDQEKNQRLVYEAKITILSTGGYGQLFSYSTNPDITTGDGIIAAYEGGCVLKDLEFVQFHPTTLYQGDKKPVSIFLISEAVRGEGAILRNVFRERFMPRYHQKEELAPRDVVSRSILEEMQKTNSDHVLLDLSEIDLNIKERFPNIYYRCQLLGIDIRKDLIPVSPAAHYCMGGIETNLWGKTKVDGLYAAGECANVGVHGANRLASNSLLDGLVFGNRAAREGLKHLSKTSSSDFESLLGSHFKQQVSPKVLLLNQNEQTKSVRLKIQNLMWQNVGILREKSYLQKTLQEIEILKGGEIELDVETQNLLQLAELVTQAALTREESRGAHFRKDKPELDDIQWRKSIRFEKDN